MAVKTTKDGRVIRTDRDYTLFRRVIYARCESRCEGCGKYLEFAFMQVHHTRGRGAGRRNDIPEAVLGLCFPCHERAHGR